MREVNKVVKIYIRAVKDGRITLEQIPPRWRSSVAQAIENEAKETVREAEKEGIV